MTAITKNCAVSGNPFVIDDYDQAFYDKIGVPLPTLSPLERLRRKMMWRNERTFYHRKCNLCQKQIISIYKPESPFTIYCSECWWSDKWDPMNFAQSFDFSRPFFEQMHELQLKVPRLALYQKNGENSHYTNHTTDLKDCYMSTDTVHSENIYYSKWVIKSKDCSDCYSIENAELCYGVEYSEPAYNLLFSFFANGCSNSAFLYACLSCKNCFMCSNLVQKEYCIRNVFVGKEAYEAFMKSIHLISHKELKAFELEYEEMVREAPKCESIQNQCENCRGDMLDRSKNVFDSFETIYSQDCRYCVINVSLKDCMDTYESAFDSELQYECHGCNGGKRLRFSHVSYDNYESDYLDSCHNSHQLFACVGLKRREYCIFNKQYSKEEYEILVPKIIMYMKTSCEWGEFFPAKLSPFAYNETVANEYMPLTKEQAESLGLRWFIAENESAYQGPVRGLPDALSETPDEVMNWILRCEISGDFYKITKQELALHKKLGLALPRLCPQQRFANRLSKHRPFDLREAMCSDCQKPIHTALNFDEKCILCKSCYLARYYS